MFWALLRGNRTIAALIDNLPAVIKIAAQPLLFEFTPIAAAATAAHQKHWKFSNATVMIKVCFKNLVSRPTNFNSIQFNAQILCNSTTAFLYFTPQAIFEQILTLHGMLNNND